MNIKKIVLHRKNIGILLGLLTIGLGRLMPETVVEQCYSRGLFVGVRWLFTGLNSWLPFASVYLLFGGVLGWLGWRLRILSQKKETTWGQRFGRSLHSLLAFAGVVLFLFQWLWGFNYGRVPLERQMGFVPAPLTMQDLRTELDAATALATAARQSLPEGLDTVIAPQKMDFDESETMMRVALNTVLREQGYPLPGKVRGRTLWPKGLLLRISTAGVYIPFTGEGNVDAGLHHFQRPFVLAHEMGHAYGFGDEGTCNFLAYLACIQSDDPYIRYIGHLYYWRYVAAQYLAFDPEGYRPIKEALHPGLRADVRAINREMDKYPDILPELRDAAYNTYLQSQGIAEGIKNYDRVVMLVAAWRKKHEVQ